MRIGDQLVSRALWCHGCGRLFLQHLDGHKSTLTPAIELVPSLGAGGSAPSVDAASTPTPAAGRPGTPTPTAPEAPPVPSEAYPDQRCGLCDHYVGVHARLTWDGIAYPYCAHCEGRCRPPA